MSFIDKFIGRAESVDPKARMIESITINIANMFANRCDEYWAYDFVAGELVAIHEAFKKDPFSQDFAAYLTRAIAVYDNRIRNISVEVIRREGEVSVMINGCCKCGDEILALPAMKFKL